MPWEGRYGGMNLARIGTVLWQNWKAVEPTPDLQAVMDLIPEEKRIVVVTE